MRIKSVSMAVCAAVLFSAAPAWASDVQLRLPSLLSAATPTPTGLRFEKPNTPASLPFVRDADGTASATPLTFDVKDIVATAAAQTPVGPPPFEYSDGYRTRAKIHKLSSWVMLPLFGLEAYLGQKMFNDVSEATDSTTKLHRSIAWGIGGLFAVNTVTGLPNLLEGRSDPNKSDLSLIHGILMLVADAGFLATALTQPDHRTSAGLEIYTPKKNQHLTIAYASISVATVGYLLALFGK
jgi:hypothetical protein